MVNVIKKIIAAIGLSITLIPISAVFFDPKFKELVIADLRANKYKCLYSRADKILFLSYMLIFDLAFRAGYYFRLKFYNHNIIFYLSKILLRDKKDIDLWGDIGGGLCIYHGQGCVIVLNKAGKNLSIYQGVTIGKNPRTEKYGISIPTFGDDVSIYANAVVVGNIYIGSNVQIGAGAVVTKDVPDNCTVVGNPMRIVHH